MKYIIIIKYIRSDGLNPTAARSRIKKYLLNACIKKSCAPTKPQFPHCVLIFPLYSVKSRETLGKFPSAVSFQYEFFRTLANWRLGSHRRLFTLLFRNNGSRRRRRNGASVNSRQVASWSTTRPRDRSSFVAISREGKRKSIEILAVPKINYGMSARRGGGGGGGRDGWVVISQVIRHAAV